MPRFLLGRGLNDMVLQYIRGKDKGVSKTGIDVVLYPVFVSIILSFIHVLGKKSGSM